MNRIVLVVLLIVLSLPLHATQVSFNTKIDYIYPLWDGRVVLVFRDDNAACTNGSNPKYYYLEIGSSGVTDRGLENIYSAAMFAAAQDLSVNVTFESSSIACYINRLSVVME